MKIIEIKRDHTAKVIRDNCVHPDCVDGGLNFGLNLWNSRTNEMRVFIPADELIEMAEYCLRQANRNNKGCPVEAKISWQHKEK